MDLFGDLVIELGSLWELFGILDLGFDIREVVLCSSTEHWHG